jgi:pimeloyl-ACP methyl ester carboxylesterase
MWYDVAERLDGDDVTMALMDFRGCGLSDRPSEGHDLEGYASDLRAVLESIDAPVTIVGHSMGGKIAQYVAAERPPNLERLILVAPGTAKSHRFSEKHREISLAAFGSRDRIEAFQRAAMAREIPPEALKRIVDDALQDQREAWFGWYDHGRTIDFSERLSEIRTPAIAVAGGADPLAPPSRIKRDVAGAIEGCLFVTLRNAGHNLPVETPAEIAAIVTRFR